MSTALWRFGPYALGSRLVCAGWMFHFSSQQKFFSYIDLTIRLYCPTCNHCHIIYTTNSAFFFNNSISSSDAHIIVFSYCLLANQMCSKRWISCTWVWIWLLPSESVSKSAHPPVYSLLCGGAFTTYSDKLIACTALTLVFTKSNCNAYNDNWSTKLSTAWFITIKWCSWHTGS